MVSPYNATLREQIAEQARAFASGETSLRDLGAFVASRVNLFENDRSGIREATLGLVGELEHIEYTSESAHADAVRELDEYLARFA